MIGTIGSPVIVEQEPNFAIKNVALIKFIPISPTNYFVHAFLASNYFDSIVTRGNRGGTQKFLSLGDIRSIQVPQPPKELQENFTQRVVLGKQILKLALTSSTKLEETFASLQHRAFRGEL